jgi:hypothetical protein
MLTERQETRRATYVDEAGQAGPVTLMIAIRGVGTCELAIRREKWDPLLFLDLLDRHGAIQ